MSLQFTEGKIPFVVGEETFETYYKLVGDIANCTHGPLIVLHGGPGISHDYMIPLADLVSLSSTTAVIFYDQLGNGQSTRLRSKNTSFWTIDLFIAELENVLTFFGVASCFNILGHSWGGTLASEFIVRRQPAGLRCLILANALASSKLRNESLAKLRPGLPEDSEEYKAAMMVFWAKHGCRIQPFPPEFLHSLSLADEDPTVLDAMTTGEAGLATRWDISSRIRSMSHISTLVINGEHDYMADSVCGPFFWGIDRVKWVKFANSSHTPHWEERECYVEVVNEFLIQGFVVTLVQFHIVSQLHFARARDRQDIS
ncbi:Proline-specific peptidase [Mycena sanguinolenta]|uniref:Proline-specific peptidase n=1 Tax=Mycena sanguinolenta TaxID=230812 RepID=A0A8H6Y849_9AGAR|nr:Proline-specific peptidase [Mycena sanguinolenta]